MCLSFRVDGLPLTTHHSSPVTSPCIATCCRSKGQHPPSLHHPCIHLVHVTFPVSASCTTQCGDTFTHEALLTDRVQYLQRETMCENVGVIICHCGKADVRTIGYLQHNMAGTSNDKILLT